MKWKPFFLTLILAIFLFGMGASETAARKMTVMIYMCGSNLESGYGAATADLEEMVRAGINGEEISVLVMAGGSSHWRLGLDPGKTTVLEIGANSRRIIERMEGMNMGQAEALSVFLSYGASCRPAEQYALIIWDHGAGPVSGVCWDERNSGDHLTLGELKEALEKSPFREKKLEWIGFDACLMSSLEVAGSLVPYARYMIASQAEEPATGWNYHFLNGLEKDADGAETGKRVIDSYFAAGRQNGETLTMACVDLSQIKDIVAGMDAMYRRMAEGLNRETFNRLARLRQNAMDFGRGVVSSGEKTGYDLTDLLSLCACYSTECPEDAARIRQATEQAVICTRASLDGCCGLSVYHPFRNQVMFLKAWGSAYTALNFCPGYSAFVSAYGQIMSGERMLFWNQLNNIHAEEAGAVADPEIREAQDDLPVHNGARITLNLTEEQMNNLASARLVVLSKNLYDFADESYFRVFTTADVSQNGTTLSAVYNRTSLQVVNEAGFDQLTGSISYRLTEDGTYVVSLYPYDENGERVQEPVWAEYEKDDREMLKLKGYVILDELTGMFTRRAEVDLSRYAGITFLNEYRNLTRNETGEILAFDSWQEDIHRDTHWQARMDSDRVRFLLSFSLDTAHAQTLFGAFELTDTQGNYWMSELVPLDQGGMSWDVPEVRISAGLEFYNADILYQAEKRSAQVMLDIRNDSDSQWTYWLAGAPARNELKINGRDVSVNTLWLKLDDQDELQDYAYREMSLDPGDKASLIFELNEDVLKDFHSQDMIGQISGTLLMTEKENPSHSARIGFALRTGIPMTAFLPESARQAVTVAEYPPCELILPALDGEPIPMAKYVALRPAEATENSRIFIGLAIQNPTKEDLQFALTDIQANGIPISGDVVSTAGTGILNNITGKRMLSPGETGSASIVLRYENIAELTPDVTLQEITCNLVFFRQEEEESRTISSVPLQFRTEIPLDAFYRETSVLPPRELVQMGRAAGWTNAADRMALLDLRACQLDLQGIWGIGRNVVLLLSAENRSISSMDLYLGQATLDGMRAFIGRSRNIYAVVRDRKRQFYGLTGMPWAPETGAHVELESGERKLFYVSITPDQATQTEFNELSFYAFLYPPENPQQCLYTDEIRLITEEACPLQEGIMAVASPDDYRIVTGQPMIPKQAERISRDIFALPKALPQPVHLQVAPETGKKIHSGYAAIFRRVFSDRELAEQNIMNLTNTQTGSLQVDLSGERPWLIYEEKVMLTPLDDGSACADLPVLSAVIRTEYGRMPIRLIRFNGPAESRLSMQQAEGYLSFTSTAFPGAVLPWRMESITLEADFFEGTGRIKNMKQTGEEYAALAGMIIQKTRLIPEDAPAEEFLSFLAHKQGGMTLSQILYMGDGEISFNVEELPNPEECVVIFLYETTDGETVCTTPQPLC